MRRLAAEIPDIFIPLSRNDVRNDDDIFDSDVFPAGDSFTRSGVDGTREVGFPPRAVSPEAACVSDHSCGQALAPATAPSPTAKVIPPNQKPPRAVSPEGVTARGFFGFVTAVAAPDVRNDGGKNSFTHPPLGNASREAPLRLASDSPPQSLICSCFNFR